MAKDDESREADNNDANGQEAGPGFKAYLKLVAVIFVSLLLFAAVLRGCSACQKKNPITGEMIEQPPPPPPPPG